MRAIMVNQILLLLLFCTALSNLEGSQVRAVRRHHGVLLQSEPEVSGFRVEMEHKIDHAHPNRRTLTQVISNAKQSADTAH